MNLGVSIIYSENGWFIFKQILTTLSNHDQSILLNLLNSSTNNSYPGFLLGNQNEMCFHFEQISDCDIGLCLIIDMSMKSAVDLFGNLTKLDNEFNYLSVDSGGYSYRLGNFISGTISLSTKKVIDIKGGVKHPVNFSQTNMNVMSPIQSANNTQAPAPMVINNHTCVVCGNNKCNKSERSCWKCGSTI